jgi:hypothetical protein
MKVNIITKLQFLVSFALFLLMSTAYAAPIDVLVLYTPAAVAKNGNLPGNVRQAIKTAIDNANTTVYPNSGISTSLRFLHAEQISFTETTNLATVVANIKNDVNQILNGTSTVMQNARKLREMYGADVVVLLGTSTAWPCGIAASIPGASNTAFAVAVDSLNYCLRDNTIPHEIGHLQGAHHDSFVDKSGTLAYGHGYVYISALNPPTASTSYRTVMAYDNACQARFNGSLCVSKPIFSNPSKVFPGTTTPANIPAGNITTANNA